MAGSMTVARRKVHRDGYSYRATIPKEIVDRLDIADGDTLVWEDRDGSGELHVSVSDDTDV